MGATSADRRRDSAFAVIVRSAHVLLVRPRRGDRWKLPGGGMKRRESPRAAVRREVEEETGLTAMVLRLTGTYERSDGSIAVVYAARVAPGTEPSGPRNEIREQRWVPRLEALRMLPRKTRRRLAEALSAPSRSRRRLSLRRNG